MRHHLPRLCAGATILLLAACGDKSTLPQGADIGPQPELKAPNKTLIPTVNIAKATGWPAGVMPTAAAGLEVNAFATALDHPRWVYVLPNGDVLVAESNAPAKPDDRRAFAGLDPGQGDGPRRRRRAEREPHHAAARCRRRRRGRAENRLPEEPAFAIRHGAGGRHAVRGQCRCHRALHVQGRRHRDHGAPRSRSRRCRAG